MTVWKNKLHLLEDELPIGIVQTTLNANNAWLASSTTPTMSLAEDARAWKEIRLAMKAFADGSDRPKVTIFPELSLPRTRLREFQRLVAKQNTLAVIGLDYRLDEARGEVANDALIFVPKGFWKDVPSRSCVTIRLGKTYAAPAEESKLAALTPPWKFVGEQNVYVIDAGKYGAIGVSICYDFMDLERALMYRGQIHHLFVLAYNKDVGTFQSLASSLSRTIFCNVVICNTGVFGGSIVVSPYRESYRRTIYAHTGAGMYTTQVAKLPVRGLAEAREGISTKGSEIFKNAPPGVISHVTLSPQNMDLMSVESFSPKAGGV